MSLRIPQYRAKHITEVDEWILNFGSAYLQKIHHNSEFGWFDLYVKERKKTDYPGWKLIKNTGYENILTRSLTRYEQTLWEKHPESSFSADGEYLVINQWEQGYNLKKHVRLVGCQDEASEVDYRFQELSMFWLKIIIDIFIVFLLLSAIGNDKKQVAVWIVVVSVPVRIFCRAAELASKQ